MGPDGVVDLPAPGDLDRECVTVGDAGPIKLFVFEGAEESLDQSVGLRVGARERGGVDGAAEAGAVSDTTAIGTGTPPRGQSASRNLAFQ
nr:hypothetical protein [Antrihabitans sp. YC2-6]